MNYNELAFLVKEKNITLQSLAKEIGMLEGNRAHYHFKGYTTTFSQKTMEEDFIEKPELIKEMKEVIDPVLKSYIGNTYQEEINNNIIYDLYDD